MRRGPALSILLPWSIVLAVSVGVARAQGPAVEYAYDELGRLVAVADPQGNAAIYTYDAVGNLLSIQRLDAAALGPVAITAVVPEHGRTGTVVSILGKGFSAVAPQNAVAFNGVAAPVVQASSHRLVTAVPSGATTGPITVTTPLGSAVSPRPFRVAGAIAVVPAAATLGVGASQQFQASGDAGEAADVAWAVEGIIGGGPSSGTISGSGWYVAPAALSLPRTVAVSAISRTDTSIVATALVTLRPPTPVFLAAAAVSVQPSDPTSRILVAPGVGLQRASGAEAFTAALPIGVSPPMSTSFAAAQVSASLAPIVTSVVPATVARGSAGVPVTLGGSGLAGLIGIDFLLNNAVDTTISIADTTTAPDGTEVSARITVAAGAVVGPRVVRIRTVSGATTSVGTGGNVFTVP